MLKPLRFALLAYCVSTALFGLHRAEAGPNKFDVGFGYFGVNAKTSTASGSSSGIGLYQFNFRRAVKNKFEVAVGYTVYFTGIISGDSGSGLDLGVNYFPLTAAGPIEDKGEGAEMMIEELWRPYIGVTFNQRNFQSVQTTYSGYGFLVGLERVLNANTNINSTVRMITLSGPKASTAKETDLFLGLGFKF